MRVLFIVTKLDNNVQGKCVGLPIPVILDVMICNYATCVNFAAYIDNRNIFQHFLWQSWEQGTSCNESLTYM